MKQARRHKAPWGAAAPLLLAVMLLAAWPVHAAKPVVELYVTSWCPYCKKAAAYFQAKGIAVKEYDIEKDGAAAMRFRRFGVRGVPVVVIGDKIVAGYSVEDYDRALRGK